MNLLADWLWQGVLIAAVTSLAVRLVPAGAAAMRHAIWWVALGAVLLLPWLPPAFSALAPPLTGPAPAGIVESAGLTLPLPPAWLLEAAAVLWLATAAFGLVRLFAGVRSLRHLARDSSPLNPEHEARLAAWIMARPTRRRMKLRVSRRIPGACAIGFLRPTILVSSDLCTTLSDDAVESIVLHECAHLERYDDWTRLVQQLVLAVAGLHPAVRWISRAIDLEREVACDQWVVARTGAPVVFARGLIEAATRISNAGGRMPTVAPGASTTMPMLRTRVRRLVEESPVNKRVASRASCWCLVCMLAAVIASDRLSGGITFAAWVPPLLTASTTPVSADAIHQLPRAGLTRLPRVTPVASAATDMPRALRVTTSPSAEMGEQRTRAAVSVIEPGAAPEIALPPAMAALTSAPVTPLVSTSLVSSAPVRTEPDLAEGGSAAQRFTEIGGAAARAGTATGATASRAGKSVGRFFRTGGLAIARKFQVAFD